MSKRIWLIFVALPAFGQTLKIQPETVAIGQKGTATISFASSAKKKPLAIQWDFELPETAVVLNVADIVAGEAATASAKSVACSRVHGPDLRGHAVFRCILYGGEREIEDGPVAVLNFTTAPHAQPRAPWRSDHARVGGRARREEGCTKGLDRRVRAHEMTIGPRLQWSCGKPSPSEWVTNRTKTHSLAFGVR